MRKFGAILAVLALLFALTADATRETPSTRLSSQATSSGAKTASVTIPSGTTNAVIAFYFSSSSNNTAPTSVSLDGQTATKKVSNETAGTMEIALYTVPSGLSTGSGKTLAWTNGTGYTVLDIGIEYRDGTPTYGGTDTDNCNNCGTLTTSAISNTSGDEILCAMSANGSGSLTGSGSGQTTLDLTSGASQYGFSTKTGAGGTTTLSFTWSATSLEAYTCIDISSATPPTFSVSPAIGTRTTSTIPVTATTACTDCTFYGIEQTAGDAAPTVAQIIAGQDHTGSAAFKACSVAMTANVQGTCTFSSITDGTVKDGYYALKSTGSGNIASAVSIANQYKIPAFTTPLTVSSTSATAYTSNAKVLDGAGSVYWVYCNLGASAPSVAQVEAQTGGCIRASSSGTATGAQTLTAPDSPAFPGGDLYYVGTYGSQHEAAVHTLTGQCLSPASGFQFTNCPSGLTSVTDTGSVPKAFNDAAFRTVGYKTQTVNFTLGSMVVDNTSGAWGFILLDSDAGATGTLTILKVSGSFANNDVLFDQGGGAALASGADAAYPTPIATTDILEVPTTVSPSGAALTVDNVGQYSYTASGRQTASNGLIYDKSAAAYMTLDLDFVANNATPSNSAPQFPFFSHGTTIDYNVGALFADADVGDTLTFGRLTALPAGTSFNPTTGHLTGTVNTDAVTAMTFVAYDTAYAYNTQSVTMTVATSWPMPNCLSPPTLGTACVDNLQVTTNGQVLINVVYVCNPAAFDLVVAQSPAAGTTLHPMDSVTITVSAANTCVNVPNCLGLNVTACDVAVNSAAPGATVTPLNGCVNNTVKIYTQGPAVNEPAPSNFNLMVMCR